MFELLEYGISRRARHNPLEQLATFYGFGDDSNAGGMDGNSGGAAGTGAGANGGSEGSGGGYDALGNSTGTSQATANTPGYGNNANDPNAPGASYGGYSDPRSELTKAIDTISAALDFNTSIDAKANVNAPTGGFSVDFSDSSRTEISYDDDTVSVTFDPVGWGTLNASVSVANTTTGAMASGGALATNLTMMGVPAAVAIGLSQLAGIAVGVALGAPAIATALSTISMMANQAAINGTISAEANDAIQFGVALAQFGLSMKGFIESAAGMASMSGMLSTSGKLAMAAVVSIEAYGMYEKAQALNQMAKNMGINTNDISSSDLAGFDRDQDRGGDGIGGWGSTGGYGFTGEAASQEFPTVEQAFEKLLKWKILNDVTTGKGHPMDAGDVFDKMAGGVLYNAFFGGSMFFHPLQQQEQNMAAVGRDTVFSSMAMPALLTSERVFLQNTKTTSGSQSGGDGGLSPITVAKMAIVRQIQALQKVVNSLMDAYNAKIAAWEANNAAINNIASSYNSFAASQTAQINSIARTYNNLAEKTQAAYDAATAQMSALSSSVTDRFNSTNAALAAQTAAFDYTGAQTFLDQTGTSITNTTAEINRLADRL